MFAYNFCDVQPSQKAKFLNCYLSQKFNGPPCIYTAIDHKAFTETEGLFFLNQIYNFQHSLRHNCQKLVLLGKCHYVKSV